MSWKSRAVKIDDKEPTTSSWKDRATPVREQVSELESLGRGALSGASLGFSDEITGGVEALWEKAKGNPEEFGKLYAQSRDESRNNNMRAEEDNPWSYGAGQVGGTIATAFVPGALGVKGASLAGRAGLAAAEGATAGLGSSNAEDISGLAKDTAIGAALGGGLSAGGELAAKGISKGLSKVPGLIDKSSGTIGKIARVASGADAEAAQRQILRPTQTAAAESDEFAYNLGKKALQDIDDIGNEAGEAVGKARDNLIQTKGTDIPKGIEDVIVDGDNFLNRHAPSKQGFSALDSNQREEYRALLDQIKSGNAEDLVKAREYIDQVEGIAKKYDVDGTGPYINQLKKTRGMVDGVLDDFDRSFDMANKDYAQFATDKATLGLNQEKSAERIVSNIYGANKTAVQKAAEMLRPSVFEGMKDIAANKAFKSANVPGGENYFRRAAVGVLTGGMSEVVTNPTLWKHGLRGLGKAGQKLGKFGPVLEKAAQRGPQALTATNFLLQQTDPEYRQLLKEKVDDEED